MSSTSSSDPKDETDKVVGVEMDEKTVLDFIYGNTSLSQSKDPKTAGNRNERHSPDEFLEVPSSEDLPTEISWRDEGLFHSQESYSSLGDKGTTASVNAYGSILQISRYLGTGTSGIFCADPCIPEPWYLRERMQQLLELSTDPDGGFGLCLNPDLVSSKPRLQFLHNRWPRYTHKIDDMSVSIQYFANRGTVIQQYIFERTRKSGAHTSGGVDGDASQTPHLDHATETEAETSRAQENQMPDAGEQTQHSPGDYPQEGQAEQKQTHENLFPENDTKLDETFGTTQMKSSIKDCLRLKSLLQIRESEWTDYSNHFNMDYPDHSSYKTFAGQNQYSLVVRHQHPDADEAVGLVIAAFVNGHPTKIAKTQGNNGRETYEIDLDFEDGCESEQGQGLRSDDSLEITVAYKLRLMAKEDSWKSTIIPISVLDFTDLMTQSSMAHNLSGQGLSLSTSAHFDFIMKRNLEHILSVCSIPVSVTPMEEDGSAGIDVLEKSAEEPRTKTREARGGTPIALTCGDISGHHIVVSASFFAFRFLLAIYSHIEGKQYVKLEKRILEILTGHLEWIFLCIEKDPGDSGQFFPSYWANGRKVMGIREDRNPQHTSLQVIKAKELGLKLQRSDKTPAKGLFEKIDGFIEKWIMSLRKSDNRDYCVFPRVSYWGEEEGYYLRDHILIWKALGITEVLDDLLRPMRYRFSHPNIQSYYDEREKRKLSFGVYASDEARRRILKRFTTQNPRTKERMFAIYRDPQNNSFLLDSEDTVLFYDEEQFFVDPVQGITNPKQRDEGKVVSDEWVRTLDVQPRRRKTNDKDWQEPLQYALVLQMGKKGYQIDSRSASDTFDDALKVLLQSCFTSGIFPGYFNRDNQLSRVFNDDGYHRWSGHDSYWHASFELPYILWMCAKERLEETSSQDKKQGPLEKLTAASQKPNKQIQPRMGNDQNSMPKLLRAETGLEGQDFSDQKNIFEFSDEWLHSCPEFLHYDPQSSFDNFQKTNPEEKLSATKSQRLVVDIPKRRNQYDDQTLAGPQPCTGKEFFDRLLQRRAKKTNMLIKKRIIWLSSGDKEAAAICPIMVPEPEQLALKGFLGKHNNWEKHFLDDPSARSNSWKTEFQLSFYQLGNDKQEQGAQSKPEIALAKRIRRGGMGFRFHGDFFDCYWTCHIVTSGDGKRKVDGSEDTKVYETTEEVEALLKDCLSRKVGSSELAVSGSGPEKCAWHQRKVLELILFEEIIKEVTAGTQKILEEINNVLASATQSGLEDNNAIMDLPDKIKETVLFSKIDSNAYFSFSSQWEVLQQLLQVLNEDLNDTFKRISRWQSREKSRGKETPRWTKKDEVRYRPALRRMQNSNSESIRELQQLQEKVQALRSSLISRRDYIRDDLNLLGAENTRYFTYVTVVFLPLGFATGIFSMSETPAGSTLARMSGTAVITFALTVIVLYFVVDLLEAFKRFWAALAKPVGSVTKELKQLLQQANKELKRQLRPVERALKPFYPPLFITYVLLRALGELMANVLSKLWATSAKSLAGVKRELERFLLPLFFAYVLWSVLGGSLSNLLNGQDLPSPQGSNDRDTDRRDSTAYLPERNPQDQPAKRKRSASRSDDLENQVGSHSFR